MPINTSMQYDDTEISDMSAHDATEIATVSSNDQAADLAAFEEKIADKSHIHLHHNFVSMTCLCFLKENVVKYRFSKQKRGSILWSCLMVIVLEMTMLYCIFFAIARNENGEYPVGQAHSFELFMIKIPCVIALHLHLSPEVENGMVIMKFANQQCHKFVDGGSEVAFVLGLAQGIISVATQIVCLRMLAFQKSIVYSVIHYVAMIEIVEMPAFYFESLIDNRVREVMHHMPTVERRGRDILFSERSYFHQVARIIYQVDRATYLTFIYYFIPYAVVFYQWLHPGGDPAVKSSAYR